jgi:ABC-type multidrug transport system fused ATPase/permease subunit
VLTFRFLYAIQFDLQTLYVGTIRFNVLLGATKPNSEVTQEELEQACRDANILDFVNSLPEFVFCLWYIVRGYID